MPKASALPPKGSYVIHKKDGALSRIWMHPKIKGQPQYDLDVGKQGGVLICSRDVALVSDEYASAWMEGASGRFAKAEEEVEPEIYRAALAGRCFAALRAARLRRLGLMEPTCPV